MTDWIGYPYEFPWTFLIREIQIGGILVLGGIMSLDSHLLSATVGSFSRMR